MKMDYYSKKHIAVTSVLTGVMLTVASGMAMSTAFAASSANSSAAPKWTEAQALAIVNKTFSIPSGYSLQSENFNQGNSMVVSSYNFSYQMQAGNFASTISATIDANTGTILNYYANNPNVGFVYPAPVSQSQAQSLAEMWVKKLYAGKMAQVKLIPPTSQPQGLTTPTVYTFNFERMIHGIPAPFDGFSIAIDQNGNLSNISYQWTTNGLTLSKPSISAVQAQRIYQKSLLLYPSYVQQWTNGNVTQNILAYVQNQPDLNTFFPSGQFSGNQTIGSPVIDASSGHLIDASGKVYQMTPYVPPTPLVKGGPALPANLQKVNWTRAQAFQYAERAVAILGYSLSELKLQSSSEYGGGNNDDTWNFSWSAPQKVNVNISIDATYGYVNSFYENPFVNKMGKVIPQSGVPKKVKISEAQALTIAKKDLAALYPNNTGGISVTLQSNQKSKFGNSWMLTISDLVNGIPYLGDTGNLAIDFTTGKVQNMNINFTPVPSPLPSPKSAISVSNAQAIWRNLAKLQLEYVQVYTGKGTQKIVLAYAPILPTGNNLTLNAVTGQFLFAGYPKNSLPYSGPINDLQGVPGASQIEVLANRDLVAVSPAGKVDPQQTVTLGDFIQLLTSAFAQYNQYNPLPGQALPAELQKLLQQVPATSLQEQQAISTAYELGWLPSGETLNVNAPLTRMVAAEILVRVLDLTPLLSHSQAFTLQATDATSIPSDHFAAAALAVNLGVIPLQNGAFNPSSSMNLSDEAIAVVAAANIASQMHLYGNVNNGMGMGAMG